MLALARRRPVTPLNPLMIHFTAFGGTDARVSAAGFTSLTVFGASQLRLPTLAERIMHRRRTHGRRGGRISRWLGSDRSVAFTMFGVTRFRQPTVMEEYSALRNLIQSGMIAAGECRVLVESLVNDEDPLTDISRVTVIGGCSLASPSKKREAQALDAAESTGAISHDTRCNLAQAIGCPPGAATEIVARAALA